MSTTLTYETGEHAGRTIELQDRPLVVGRATEADVVLHADPEVSRRHAAFQPRPDGTLVVVDLSSTNGTFVDGRRVDGPVWLRGGERVRIGNTTFLVGRPARWEPTRLSPSAAPQPPRPGAPLPVPPPPPSASMIERIRLRRSVTRANALALAAIAIAVVVVGAAGVLALTGAFSGSGDDQSASTERIVADVAPSTVDILTRQGGRPFAGGTGWVLDAAQGLIATNSHVVNGGDSWTIKVGDEKRQGIFVAAAPCEDQAVLRLAEAKGLKTIALGDQRTVKAGQRVVAVGFPVNASAGDDLTATAGVVSVPRTVYRGALDVPDLPNVIQTDAAINPGSSGGPLVNSRSQLIGMDTAGLDQVGGRPIQGQGYAIGVDRIKKVMARLKRGRSMGFTGYGVDPVPARELEAAGLPRGMHTVEAVPGSPADRKGFGDGRDRSIVSIDGKRLDGTLPQYCSVVERYRSGELATFRVGLAGGRTQIVQLKFT